MSSAPVHVRRVQAESMADDAAGSLDVGWLLHSKKGEQNLYPQTMRPIMKHCFAYLHLK
jgi:hypothetical protein